MFEILKMESAEITSEKKRILILIDSLSFGGAEKQTISLINRLNVEKHHITLGYLNKSEDSSINVTGT